MWEVRNSLIYGKGKEKLTKEKQRIIPTITNYHNKQIKSLKHNNLFNTPLTERNTFSPKENLKWIKAVQAIA